ncbi:recombinase RecT [Photorhabdus laumondii subsp. laumondii]|uniref:Photorhabdus luminescens subsp. laumondii TTO1 complete genome segment 10/17 n=2 Tax=Photorhabdus laumondii subsp. laumondii TaxID=141679 RepID=Q7N2Y8_PHOLL|nr:RecT family recombinase [Photorhabdus laumondii]AWK42643.1 recombinase RecT [Photorhabdus laumondii subsp. laumondii]AXG47967.1 recombinase RecT [Photorhabdus laumondii subsp. laumondii]MCC8384624.1 recombinase RecT [Photorhabdus laumondii]MCC8413330.1 recombinase RecT [Photorhabdus laumondii]NDK94996.1 recombinase RecT [Photorhabdus laumondii subsp. laumondii]
MSTAVQKVYEIINPLKTEFEQICSEPGIVFKRESEFAMQIFANNDFLATTALNNPVSARSAVMNIAAIGISLNPAQKLAYLVPRNKSVCLDISYMGLMHIAQQSGAIKWCQSAVVRKNDIFKRTSIDTAPIHEYNEFDTAQSRGDIVGAYTVIKTDDCDYITHTMRASAIFDIRDRSSAWIAYKTKGKSCPWVTDEEQMILKTVVKQAAKYWPRRERLDKAIDYVNTEAGEGIDFSKGQNSYIDVTPAADSTIESITNLLTTMNKTWDDDLLPLCSKIFRRQILSPAELTESEAIKASDFLRKKAS